jgi:hypothetical protein
VRFGKFSQSFVLPSMSVKRKVTVPDGNALSFLSLGLSMLATSETDPCGALKAGTSLPKGGYRFSGDYIISLWVVPEKNPGDYGIKLMGGTSLCGSQF